jgi:hypothetical protein
MLTVPRGIAAALGVSLALTAGVPAASAATASLPDWAATPGGAGSNVASCNPPTSGIGQAPTGSTTALTCLGTGLNFVAPAIGQVAAVIGPTIIGPAVVGNLAVTAGSSAVAP